MTNSPLGTLARNGFVDIPVEIADYGETIALAYLLVERHQPVAPVDLKDDYDLSCGNLYRSLKILREDGLVTRERSVERPQAHLYRVCGPTTGEQTEHPMKHD